MRKDLEDYLIKSVIKEDDEDKTAKIILKQKAHLFSLSILEKYISDRDRKKELQEEGYESEQEPSLEQLEINDVEEDQVTLENGEAQK